MSHQLTREQAIAFHDNKLWEPMTMQQRAEFQMSQDLLCMPFRVFHEAVSKALERDVYTHEFAFRDNLRAELMGERKAPTFDEILSLIPEEKRVILVTTKEQGNG